MYVTPYDYGMSGTKGNLTGTRGTRAWAGEWIATGASSATNGDGNTTNLAARGTGYQAAYYCENLTALGYSDWYLPARNELATIITNKNEIGGFDSTGVYWSSTDLSTTNAYTIAIVDGLAAGYNKTGTYPVRCARK